MQNDEMRVRIYEWGKALENEDGLALARRFLDIRSAALTCVKLIEELPSASALEEQAKRVTQLEVTLVHELRDQISKAIPLFERVSASLHERGAPKT